MSAKQKSKAGWFVEKKLSIGVLVAILFQIGTTFYYGIQDDVLLHQYVVKTDRNTERLDKKDEENNGIKVDIATIKERQNSQTDLLHKIDERTEKMTTIRGH